MQALFEVASGSTIGRDHLRLGKNNQDSHYIFSSELATIAVVCDGCGSSEHSEVGAKIGAQLTGAVIQSLLISANMAINAKFWMEVRQNILVNLYVIAKTMEFDNSLIQILHNYFLFTIVGVFITQSETCVFSIGDGVVAVNDRVKAMDIFPNNAPPYIAYGVEAMINEQEKSPHQLYSFLTNSDSLIPIFHIHEQLPTEQVQSVLIGSDGVGDLIRVEERLIPGKQECVGAIAQFWQEDRYFSNPDMIRRQLSLINREVTRFDWASQRLVKEVGLLPDDTTLIAIRRKR